MIVSRVAQAFVTTADQINGKLAKPASALRVMAVNGGMPGMTALVAIILIRSSSTLLWLTRVLSRIGLSHTMYGIAFSHCSRQATPPDTAIFYATGSAHPRTPPIDTGECGSWAEVACGSWDSLSNACRLCITRNDHTICRRRVDREELLEWAKMAPHEMLQSHIAHVVLALAPCRKGNGRAERGGGLE